MADEEVPATTPDETEAGTVATTEPAATPVPTADVAAEAEAAHREALKTRVFIPLLLPLITAAAVLVYVLNLSRALLAGGKWGALAIASIVTLAILAGAAYISSRPRMRTSTLVMLVAGLFVLVVASGLTTIGPSEEKESAATGYVQPTGKPVDTLTVQALPTIKFNAKAYTVKSGIVQVVYVDVGGTHTLVFTDPKLNGFELAVPNGPKTGKVELKPGNYTIYCTIPGHRALGMEATVTATP